MDFQNITAENFEQVLTGLVDALPDYDAVEKDLGLDLRGLTHLMRQYVHNDDIHHNGEDVLTHTRWVLEDLAPLIQGLSVERQTVLGLAAMLHDVGKAYTYELIDGRHCFRKHGEKSTSIATALLAPHQDRLGLMFQRVLDLIRLHDKLMVLSEARKVAKNLKYLNSLLREPLYLNGHLEDLVVLSKADSHRCRRYEDSLSTIDAILGDIGQVEAAKAQQEAAKAQQRAVFQERLPEIQNMLAVEMPEASKLSDLSDVYTVLGGARRLDLIKQIKEMIG